MISIIIPTLNEERYVGKLLDSIKKQQYRDYEIVVVDAGSTDKTKHVVSKYKAKFFNIKEKNVSKQRNFGAKKAKSNLLFFTDADIVIPDIDFFSRIVKVFDDKRVMGLTTNVFVDPKNERISDRIFHNFSNWLVKTIARTPLAGGRAGCIFIRKRVFDKVHGFNEKAYVAEDVELFRKAARYGRVIFMEDLKVYESPRRFRKEGYLRVILRWCVNGIAVFLFKKSLKKRMNEVR